MAGAIDIWYLKTLSAHCHPPFLILLQITARILVPESRSPFLISAKTITLTCDVITEINEI